MFSITPAAELLDSACAKLRRRCPPARRGEGHDHPYRFRQIACATGCCAYHNPVRKEKFWRTFVILKNIIAANRHAASTTISAPVTKRASSCEEQHRIRHVAASPAKRAECARGAIATALHVSAGALRGEPRVQGKSASTAWYPASGIPHVEARLATQRAGGNVQALLQSRLERIPLGFAGDGRDTANAVLFLASTRRAS